MRVASGRGRNVARRNHGNCVTTYLQEYVNITLTKRCMERVLTKNLKGREGKDCHIEQKHVAIALQTPLEPQPKQ